MNQERMALRHLRVVTARRPRHHVWFLPERCPNLRKRKKPDVLASERCIGKKGRTPSMTPTWFSIILNRREDQAHIELCHRRCLRQRTSLLTWAIKRKPSDLRRDQDHL